MRGVRLKGKFRIEEWVFDVEGESFEGTKIRHSGFFNKFLLPNYELYHENGNINFKMLGDFQSDYNKGFLLEMDYSLLKSLYDKNKKEFECNYCFFY